jgi:hypothetical protein
MLVTPKVCPASAPAAAAVPLALAAMSLLVVLASVRLVLAMLSRSLISVVTCSTMTKTDT